MSHGSIIFANVLLYELNEGIHLDSNQSKLTIDEIIDFYGEKPKICLFSNRVNSYSVSPQLWNALKTQYPNLLVAYSTISYLNATLEKRFTDQSIKRCKSLEEAINRALSLNEFN